MPRIFDNIEKHLNQGLKDSIEVAYKSDFCIGYFNLRGWKHLADYVERWEGGDEKCCRLLIGMQKHPQEVLKDYFNHVETGEIDNKRAKDFKTKLAHEFRNQLTIGIPTDQDEITLRQLKHQLLSKKVVVKLFLKHTLHAKLYLLYRDDKNNPRTGFVGSSNLTMSGLAKQGELNVDVLDHDASEKLEKWFADRWEDRWCIDITEELAEIIEESWAREELIPPYHIYLKIAYHLSQEARSGLSEFKLPKEFEKKLFPFQQQAVKVAAHHLNKRNGVLIGDVVGLGKTITATALARIFEEDFSLETLIICPKNLVKMWEDYAFEYRLRAKVLSITKVQGELTDMRRYRLLIIDESHNLRNRFGKRYRAIHEYIKLNGSKVILLTATPYNKTYLDLSGQLRLFIDDDQNLGVSPERYIERIGGKTRFLARHQTAVDTLPAFEHSEFIDDWRELMKLFLVRRTRSFVKNHYALTDKTNGRQYLEFPDGSKSYFPDRVPKAVQYPYNPEDSEDQYARLYSPAVVSIIAGLNLARYGLGNYLNDNAENKATEAEKTIIQNLSRAGRRLKGFARTNLFKRLESSGWAFLLSVSRQVMRNYTFIYAIENKEKLPVGQQEANMLDYFLEDKEPDGESKPDITMNLLLDEKQYLNKAASVFKVLKAEKNQKKFDWIKSDLFEKKLKDELYADSKNLLKILEAGKEWKALEDRQLNRLFELITKDHPKEKVLIFTQYADTAYYLCDELKRRKVKSLECVTGDVEEPREYAVRFSPKSNGRSEIENELRVLVTTDVLSEGQNLQDAHIVVNYDLPWAIIRLIQRAGRIDRIGQQSKEIICYSFLPENGVEQIINLRGRLRQRIEENAEVVGADEVFFEGDPVNLADLYNEKSGILDDAGEEEVDLASYAYQIWKDAIDADPKLKQIITNMPDVVYSTKPLGNREKDEGTVVYCRTGEGNDVLTYVDSRGGVVTQSQFRILRALKCTPETPALERLPNHHDLVAKGVDYVREFESQIGGQLGHKRSARYRVYMSLEGFYNASPDDLFAGPRLKAAIDEIYQFPLKEYARDILNRQLKTGISDTDLSELVINLREEDRLCIVDPEGVKEYKAPQIICSMGLKEEN